MKEDETTIKVTASTKEKLKAYKEIFNLHSMEEVITQLLVNAKVHAVKTIQLHQLDIAKEETADLIKIEGKQP